jgi:cytochrome c peroxidase
MRTPLMLASVLAAAAAAACTAPSEESTPTASVEQAASGASANRGHAFFNQGFPNTGDNGRACETCHVESDSFALTPAHVEERFQNLQRRRASDPTADDPLFRSIDANDGANDFTNLRKGLVRVVMKLPTGADGKPLIYPADDPNATEVSVWRAVPTVNNVALTAPYQLDGRFPTLQIQANAALHAHSEITREPTAGQLDDVAAFQLGQFSSAGVQALAAAIAAGQPAPATDPPLNALEQQGKAAFQHHCTACHGGATQTTPEPFMPPAILDIFVSKPPPPFAGGLPFADPPVPPRLWIVKDGPTDPATGAVIKAPDGSSIPIPSTDPGRALITGSFADWNHFDMPTLFGISKTAPYFHDNSAATLEDMLHHYQSAFIAVRRVIPDFVPHPIRPDELPDSDIPPLVAYLKKI